MKNIAFIQYCGVLGTSEFYVDIANLIRTVVAQNMPPVSQQQIAQASVNDLTVSVIEF